MVFCGKASLSCEPCRLKRIKCDQKRPECTQCRKRGDPCLGYREAIDLLFRDESQRVVALSCKKAAARKLPEKESNTHARPENRPDDQLLVSVACSRRSQSPPLLPPINEPIHNVAVSFLLSDYIRGSHFDYLPRLWNAHESSGVLCPTLKAVGLASLSLYTSRPELREQAARFYGEAIKTTNDVLQSKVTSTNDDVLASVLLLSLYEGLSVRSNRDDEAWSTHIQGALVLLTLRGPKQFQSTFGFELFRQIAVNIRVFCVQHRLRIPKQLLKLTQMARRYSDAGGIAFEYSQVFEAFTTLRADIVEGILHDPDDIIARAEEVLQVIENLCRGLSTDLQYDTLHTSSSLPEIYSRYFHRFTDHHTAQMWNTTWMAKLQLYTIIHQQLQRLQEVPAPQHDRLQQARKIMKSTREVARAAENICASVPQFFPPEQLQISDVKRHISTGYFLVWPLFTAGSSPLVSQGLREYVIERLDVIAVTLKLPQARRAAEVLIEGGRDESWMHVCHVF